jgi:hypothetical protein
MRKIDKPVWVLIILFLLVFGLRLGFAFDAPGFATDESYLTERHVDEVLEGKLFSTHDELSYGGRVMLYSPLSYLIFSVLTFGNDVLMKVFTELFFALLVFVIYYIGADLTASKWYGVFAATLAGLSPVLLDKTVNNPSPLVFALPLFFFMMYALPKLKNRKLMWLFLISSFLLPLLHPLGLVFLFVVFVYLFLLGGGALSITKTQKELLFLAGLIITFTTLVIYKNALLNWGLNAVWQNMPLILVNDNYAGFASSGLLLGLGFIPLILGLIGLGFGIYRDKDKTVYLFAALMLGLVILMFFNLITLSLGLLMLSLSLAAMSAVAVKYIVSYFSAFKGKWIVRSFKILFIVVIPAFMIVTAVLTLNSQSYISQDQIDDLEILGGREEYNGRQVKVVAGNLYEGHMINALANKENVADDNFLMAPSPEDRMDSLTVLYRTPSYIIAKDILDEYGIDVIYLSEESKELFNIDGLSYVEGNERCLVENGRFIYYKCKI